LQAVRLTGAVYYLLDLTSPWETAVPDGTALAPILAARAQNIVSYHVVTRGTLWCGLEGDQPMRLDEGDVLVLPRGDAYFMSMKDAAPTVSPQAVLEFFRACAAGQVPFAINNGGDGAPETTLLCGFLGCDRAPFNPLLDALPPLLVLRRASATPGD